MGRGTERTRLIGVGRLLLKRARAVLKEEDVVGESINDLQSPRLSPFEFLFLFSCFSSSWLRKYWMHLAASRWMVMMPDWLLIESSQTRRYKKPKTQKTFSLSLSRSFLFVSFYFTQHSTGFNERSYPCVIIIYTSLVWHNSINWPT